MTATTGPTLTAVPGGTKLPVRPELLKWVHQLTEQVAPGDLTDHELLDLVMLLLDAGNRKHRRHLQLVGGGSGAGNDVQADSDSAAMLLCARSNALIDVSARGSVPSTGGGAQ